MFQLRTEPRYLKIQKLIQGGELGEIVRMSWLITDWYRTEAYYASGGWRATWKGEGGGVLLNQCLHNLDVIAWLLGMPARVRGFCQLGRYHHIEVEDNVTAYLEYPNGATGVFITSTGESPGTNRFEIAGSRGRSCSKTTGSPSPAMRPTCSSSTAPRRSGSPNPTSGTSRSPSPMPCAARDHPAEFRQCRPGRRTVDRPGCGGLIRSSLPM
jgi:predicted dehydrogenase